MRLVGTAAAVLATLLAGCTGSGGGVSPEHAVENFLEPFGEIADRPREDDEVREFWRSTCEHIAPEIRKALFFEPENEDGDDMTNCGAGTVLAVMYTGDTGDEPIVEGVSGDPVATREDGETAFVTVDLTYGGRTPPRSADALPATHRAEVMVVNRDGRWWVATPFAFNITEARAGGMSEGELRKSYAEAVAVAEDR